MLKDKVGDLYQPNDFDLHVSDIIVIKIATRVEQLLKLDNRHYF